MTGGKTYLVGENVIHIMEGEGTYSTLPSGGTVTAAHAEQEGQRDTAYRLGYASAEEMNRDHDALHILVAHWLGLKTSPTLLDVAAGREADELHAIEEDAVLALQRYCNAMEISIPRLLEPYRR